MKVLFRMAALCCAAATISLSACENGNEEENVDKTIPVESVSLNETAKTLTVGDTFKLEATVKPSDATDMSLAWSSDNTEVADVVAGTVTALAQGEATITVTTNSEGQTAICEITVVAGAIHVTEILLAPTTLELAFGKTMQLEATVLPEDATDRSIKSWESSDEAVATVDENGLVTAGTTAGPTTITVTTTDGELTDECVVTVSPLGAVSFKSDKIWEVSNGTVTQQWSDVVMAIGARGKDTYDGGSATDGFMADVRENEGYGDLFSWQAVNDFQEQLCPAPWRVPVLQDFADLDVALGGDPATWMMGMEMNAEIVGKLLDPEVWGAVKGGSITLNREDPPVYTMSQQGTMACYWTTQEVAGSPNNAHYVYVMDSAAVFGETGATTKGSGYMVRCVK